jgi:hypothetical protein
VRTNPFTSKETAGLVGGIVAISFVETGLMYADGNFIGSWFVTAVFGAIYALLGGAVWMGVQGRRGTSRP